MSLSGKPFKSAYPPEVVLAEMLGKEFGNGTSPDPEQLKAWLIRNWGTVSMLAHHIHHQHRAQDPIYAQRYMEQLGR